jgi:hypothetical protein
MISKYKKQTLSKIFLEPVQSKNKVGKTNGAKNHLKIKQKHNKN